MGASEIVYDTVDFHDIAGLVAGAHQGEGLGNRFLANIRETDAIVHVVRAHGDEGVVHPEGEVHPLRDIETIETELALADLEQAERRVERVAKKARGGDRVAVAEEAWLGEAIAALQAGHPVRGVPLPEEAPGRRARPRLAHRQAGAVCRQRRRGLRRAPSRDRRPRRRPGRGRRRGLRADRVRARRARRRGRRRACAPSSDVERVRPLAGRARGLRAAAPDRLLHRRRGQARAVLAPARGLTAWHAAGEIHSDIQNGFVRAEVIGWQELLDAGGYAAARERGTLRLEGRDYVMRDGDVITVKFTP